jgi:S-disulfanyl-L-cysteine oxidoreductase SoxD
MRRASVFAMVAVPCLVTAIAGCDRGPLAERAERAKRALEAGRLPPDVHPAAALPARFAVGRAATTADIAAWDIDVAPDGHGLPAGRGSVAQGATIFAAKCAVCHGAAGEGQAGVLPAGQAPAPKLIGRDPRDGFRFGQDPKLVKTVGNYWPYATTVFDYVRRSMPLSAPGSLTNHEVYALVAFLLAQNEIIDRSATMDSASLVAVRMPARDRFVADDRKGGAVFK